MPRMCGETVHWKRNLSRPGETRTRWVPRWRQMPRRERLWRFHFRNDPMARVGTPKWLETAFASTTHFQSAFGGVFYGHCFPLAAEVGCFYSFYNNLSRAGEKRGPFWWKSRFSTKNRANVADTTNHNQREKWAFSGENTKNRLTAPIFQAQLSNMISISLFRIGFVFSNGFWLKKGPTLPSGRELYSLPDGREYHFYFTISNQQGPLDQLLVKNH